MRIAYFDCPSGISGDMTLGALVDAGADLSKISEGIASMGLPEVKIRVREIYEDTGYLPKGFSRKWWGRLVNGLKPKRAPVKWLGSDDPMTR